MQPILISRSWQEDLQAFHAAHFPGHPPTQIQPSTEADAEEDDLGYYPDGVKRTLTDEQIQIFRHTEIHELIRARQLEQDAAEYEDRRQGSEDGEPAMGVDTNDEDETACHAVKKENSHTKREAQHSHGARKTNRPIERETNEAALQSLDYGEGDPPTARKSKHPESHALYQRRQITYEED